VVDPRESLFTFLQSGSCRVQPTCQYKGFAKREREDAIEVVTGPRNGWFITEDLANLTYTPALKNSFRSSGHKYGKCSGKKRKIVFQKPPYEHTSLQVPFLVS
jgi:hypothetical protein